MQNQTLNKVQRNLEMLQPISQKKPYEVPSDSPRIDIGMSEEKKKSGKK